VRTEAKFPEIPARAGHYESFYIKATEPGGGRGVWIRHTIHQRPDEPATASLWFTYFDASAPGPRATKQTVGRDELSFPSGAYIRIGDSLLEPGRARGGATSESLAVTWHLGFTDESEPLHHLPYEAMYRTRLPKTKFLSPYPTAKFTGTVTIGDESLELVGWPGMIGHNWGAEHAERWVWIQASGLNGNEADYVDIAAGRIKVGGWTTPWVANGRIVIEGEPYRVGGFRGTYGTEITEAPTSCEFTIPGKGVNLKGRVGAPAKDFVAWIYADPVKPAQQRRTLASASGLRSEGPEHNTLNCSISDIQLKVERAGKPHAHVGVERAAAYEFGTRDTDHGLPLQPYPDG
jgi:hypothetical protein